MDQYLEDNPPLSNPAESRPARSDSTFLAKEVIKYSTFNPYNRQLSSTMPEFSVNPDPGDSETIWNPSASHLLHDIAQLLAMQSPANQQIFSAQNHIQRKLQSLKQQALFFIKEGTKVLKQVNLLETDAPITVCGDDAEIICDRLLKGWNEEWGNLRLPCFHARIGKLLGRDYVWVVTQTMASLNDLTLWAVHTVHTYKVYPGFWGRKLLIPRGRTSRFIESGYCKYKTCVSFGGGA